MKKFLVIFFLFSLVCNSQQIQTSKSLGSDYYTLETENFALAAPLDATNYFYGNCSQLIPSSTANARQMLIPLSGTLVACSISASELTSFGTSEASSVFFWYNNATSITLTTLLTCNDEYNEYVSGLNKAVTAGQSFETKLTTASWVVNPVGLIVKVVYIIKTQ